MVILSIFHATGIDCPVDCSLIIQHYRGGNSANQQINGRGSDRADFNLPPKLPPKYQHYRGRNLATQQFKAGNRPALVDEKLRGHSSRMSVDVIPHGTQMSARRNINPLPGADVVGEKLPRHSSRMSAGRRINLSGSYVAHDG
jgi:hypothetical protein